MNHDDGFRESTGNTVESPFWKENVCVPWVRMFQGMGAPKASRTL